MNQKAGISKRSLAALAATFLATGALAAVAQADSGWTAYFSEENGGKLCPAGERVEAVHCTGSNCDNKALYCGTAPSGYVSQIWTPRFSEETTGGMECTAQNGTRGALTAMWCNGSYCDNVQLRCGQLQAGRALTGCSWTAWHSEESGGYRTFYNQTARAVECSGGYCDNLRYLVCSQS
jgi:hypothetical protein